MDLSTARRGQTGSRPSSGRRRCCPPRGSERQEASLQRGRYPENNQGISQNTFRPIRPPSVLSVFVVESPCCRRCWLVDLSVSQEAPGSQLQRESGTVRAEEPPRLPASTSTTAVKRPHRSPAAAGRPAPPGCCCSGSCLCAEPR